MCLLSYYAPGVMPVRRELENGMEVNDEGTGFALVTPDGGMLSDKSAQGHIILHEFMNLRARYPDGPAAFHARLSTGSAVTLANMHPVEVGGDPETLLFHNGSLAEIMPLAEGESDTLRFATEYLPNLDLDDPVHDEAINLMLAHVNNKAVIITSHPRWREQAYVYNRSQWIVTPEGALHSNADFMGEGRGWAQFTDALGDLHRWSVTQPGQCRTCYRYGCQEAHLRPAATPFRYRNESERRRKVRALSMTDRPDWRYHPLANHAQNHEDVPMHECPEASCREVTAFESAAIVTHDPEGPES